MLLTREQLQERLIALHKASLELVKDVSMMMARLRNGKDEREHRSWGCQYANARTIRWQ